MKKFRVLLSILCCLIMGISALGLLTSCVGLGGMGGGDDGGSEEEEEVHTLGEAVSGIIVLYKPEANTADDKFVDGFGGGDKQFSYLIDRQISMLADDILVRLNAVYGSGLDVESTILTDKDENAVNMAMSAATYYRRDTISKHEGGYKLSDGNSVGSDVNLSEVGTIANALYGSDGTGKGLLAYIEAGNVLAKNFQFAGAIGGVKLSRADKATGTLAATTGGTTWNWGNQTYYVTGSSNITGGTYKDYLRMALADILANGYDYSADKAYTDYSFNQSTYDENLKKIDHLGVGAADAEVIKKFIKHSIIGQDLIDADNAALEILATKTNTESFNYHIQSGWTAEMEDSAFAELNSLNNIKLYETIVNGIVDSLVKNTFTSLPVKIYPEMPRLKTQYVSYALMDDEKNPYWTREGMDVKNVIIMPNKKCRLDVITFCFQQKVDLETTYYATTNVNFVVNGVSYTGTVDATINPGEIPGPNEEEHEMDENAGSNGGGYTSGSTTPPASEPTDPLMENETGVELIDIYSEYLPDGKTLADLSKDEWNAYIWEKFSGATSTTEFSTVANPFTLQQTLLDESGKISASTASFFDAGTNYLELSFQFFTKDQNDLLVPCTSMYPYSFRISNEWSTVSFGDDMYVDPNARPDQPTEFN